MTTALSTLDTIEEQAKTELEECSSLDELEDFRVKYLGRNGKISEILGNMGEVPPEDRPDVGQRANQLKQSLQQQFDQRKQQLEQIAEKRKARERWLDVTLPGRHPGGGHVHPIQRAIRDIEDVFHRMGFETVYGPEIETEFYNFEALNIPEDHPARDMHDTLYLTDDRLLRTHTSPVQIRTMEDRKPPLRIIAPGRVYRHDADQTHSPMFHQVEGLWVDETITFSELKGTLELFVKRFFDDEVELRFRPSYFPFTEPSAEIDIAFEDESGDTEWLEVLGAGMVDPAVFDAVDYDTDRWQGFAFGMGVERMAMLKYGIDNLQKFFENDLRFLQQF
ncbi:MAG: phenylalanine--tRNA ligase subunit alpha [bacterium]